MNHNNNHLIKNINTKNKNHKKIMSKNILFMKVVGKILTIMNKNKIYNNLIKSDKKNKNIIGRKKIIIIKIRNFSK